MNVVLSDKEMRWANVILLELENFDLDIPSVVELTVKFRENRIPLMVTFDKRLNVDFVQSWFEGCDTIGFMINDDPSKIVNYMEEYFLTTGKYRRIFSFVMKKKFPWNTLRILVLKLSFANFRDDE